LAKVLTRDLNNMNSLNTTNSFLLMLSMFEVKILRAVP
jgi:hypothetical protein